MDDTSRTPLEQEFAPTLRDEMREHIGSWVAMTRSHVIAAGPTPEEALSKARAAGFSNPILVYIPEDEGVFAYML